MKTAYLFSGQGSQYIGMEKIFPKHYQDKAAYFFELSRRIDPRMGVRFDSLFLKMTLAEQERVLALLKKPIKLRKVEIIILVVTNRNNSIFY